MIMTTTAVLVAAGMIITVGLAGAEVMIITAALAVEGNENNNQDFCTK
jgi:uncharacterized protein YacL (UPF0231 family)